MLQILGHTSKACDGLTRRALLQASTLALLASATGISPAAPAQTRRTPGRVRSMILIDLFGGPSHLDMFDPKPDAPAEIRGEFQAIRTSLPGVLVAEHLPRVWDVFYQVDASSTREYGGAGLGLAIVKSFVEAHGGEVTVRSTLGQGTTFTLALPREPSAILALTPIAAPTPFIGRTG